MDCEGVTLRSRPGRDCTAQFPELRSLADVLPARALVNLLVLVAVAAPLRCS